MHATEFFDDPEVAVIHMANGHGTGSDGHNDEANGTAPSTPAAGKIGATRDDVMTRADVDEPWAVFSDAAMMNGMSKNKAPVNTVPNSQF